MMRRFAKEFFTPSGLLRNDVGYQMRRLSTSAGKSKFALAAAEPGDESVKVSWKDGHTSYFAPVWLVDHNPAGIHSTSKQRQQDPLDLNLEEGLPNVMEVSADGSKLRLLWGNDREIVYEAAWLREHCYDKQSQESRRETLSNTRQTWEGKDLPKSKIKKVAAADLAKSDAAVLGLLQSLVKDGVGIVTEMPNTIDETERIVRRIGPPRETFYGGMWDTAPKSAEQVNDTAYTKDELHVHTDTCYLMDSAGLQLFNCVAQSGTSDDALEGATKLLDGFKVIEVLARDFPDTYRFFVENPLKWYSIEDRVFVKAWDYVIRLDPQSSTVAHFRYNPYDLAPVDYLPADKINDYYKHSKVLNKLIRNTDYITYVKLQVGEMLVVDNQRVCHGRTAFKGYRNMIGCYMGVDDWKSTLRSLAGGIPVVNDE